MKITHHSWSADGKLDKPSLSILITAFVRAKCLISVWEWQRLCQEEGKWTPINTVMWLRFICIKSYHVWNMLKILIYLKASNVAELSSLSALRIAFEMHRNYTNEGRIQMDWITFCKILSIFSTATFSSHDYSMLILRERYLVNQKLEDGLKWSLQHLCYDVNDLQSLFLLSVSSFPPPTGVGH